MYKILVIFGTRPEAIKLAPVLQELSKYPDTFDVTVGVTGQHDKLLKQVLEIFRITPDFDLKVMKNGQGLAELTVSILAKLSGFLCEINPDIVLVQGDTTTAFSASLAAFYRRIQVGHVEAGLRTEDKYEPFPEEVNRRLIDQFSDIFFAPTEVNRNNLLKSGIHPENIFVTGNTVVDALLFMCTLDHSPHIKKLYENQKMILLTTHRRENFGKRLENILEAVGQLANLYREIHFVFPVHPNPNVKKPAYELLSKLENVHLIEPVDYLTFIHLMKDAYLILTDSGGIQEEAPSLHKPLLILRNRTERPEIVNAGGARLVGTDPQVIVSNVKSLVEDPSEYERMINVTNPYGEGKAARKIVQALMKRL